MAILMEQDTLPTFTIISFDPLTVQFPQEQGPYSGQVIIQLPEITIKVRDVFAPGWGIAHAPSIMGTAPGPSYTITPDEGHKLEVGEIAESIMQCSDLYQQAHQIFQQNFNAHGALLKPMIG